MGIGAENAGSNPFTGTIDEPKIYNSALTADQVKLDMNRGSAQIMGALSDKSTYQPQAANQEYCIPGDSTSCAAPVGEWKFEENQGTTANDTSGNANTGTWNGTLGSQWKSGKRGAAGNFNGTDNYVNLPNSTSLTGTGSHTIEAWTLWSSSMTGSTVFLKDQDGGTGGWGMSITQNSTGSTACSVVVTSPSTVQINSPSVTVSSGWHHLTCVWNNGSSLKLYVDGVDSATTTTAFTTLRTSNQPSNMGKTNGASTYYGGKIDQVRLFNYARTASQVAWDYNRGAPVGHWKFDECQGGTAYDASGNSNNGTITIGASGTQTAVGTCTGSANTAWKDGAVGKYNSSLDFDGTDDYVSVANTISGVQTVSFWVKPSSTTANMVALTGSAYITSSSGTVSATGFTSPTIYVNGIVNGTISANAWNHVVVTTGTGISASAITFGLANSTYLSGQIDEPKIYNYTLTATQVKQLMNQGGAIRYGPVTGAP